MEQFILTPKKLILQPCAWNDWLENIETFKKACGPMLTAFFSEKEIKEALNSLNIVKILKLYKSWIATSHYPNYIDEVVLLGLIYAGIEVIVKKDELDYLFNNHIIEKRYFNVEEL